MPTATKAAPAVKMPKFPKSLGACVDMYKEWSEKRLAAAKGVEPIAAVEAALKEHIISNVPKGDAGAVGQKYKAIVKNAETFQVEDWDKFYAWIKKNEAWDVLQRAVNQSALGDRVDVMNEKLDIGNAKVADPKARKPRKYPPGIKLFTYPKLSVTKK